MTLSPAQHISSRVTLIFAPLFLALLALLHILEPEFDPSWRMIGEYELGAYGWLMQIAFFTLALASGGAFFAVWSQIQSTWGRVGEALLLLAILGILLGGTFITDPITTDQADWTTSGTLHTIGWSLMILLSPFAAPLISWSLVKHSPAWKQTGRTLLWPLLLMWLTTITFFTIVGSHADATAAGPDVPMGWPNRLFILSYCYWLITLARQAQKIHQTIGDR